MNTKRRLLFSSDLEEQTEVSSKYSEKLTAQLESGKYSEFVDDATAIEIVSEVEPESNKKIELAKNILTLAEGALTVANTILEMVNDLHNPYFNQGEIVAIGMVKMMSNLFNTFGDIIPPPGNIVAKAISFALDFIVQIIGIQKQVIYEYNVGDSHGTKYYWDGGLIKEHFWGLLINEQRGIEDLKMQAPIEVIDSSNRDIIYFNGEKYIDDNDNIVRKDAIQYMLNNNLITSDKDSKYSWVYSCEPNINKLNDTNSFASIEELTNNIINTGNYTSSLNGEFFVNGMKFESYEHFISSFEQEISQKIKPIYIAKIPELDANGYPIQKQSPAHLPYPFYEPYSELGKNLIIGSNPSNSKYMTMDAYNWRNSQNLGKIDIKQDQEYIIYNQNIEDNTTKIDIDPINYIKQRFFETFNVESKSILKSYLHSSNHIKFDNFLAQSYTLDIYLVELVPGKKKYFINRNDAVEYIIKTASNNEI